jgi:CRISPR-associated endonuclease/helicase Cas3
MFADYFSIATRKNPYDYQCRLACGDNAQGDMPETLGHGTTCCSRLINIPTGLGKTAGVMLAWLWNRVGQPDQTQRRNWPRRLVYCLPMRTLAEQTRDNVAEWLVRLALACCPDSPETKSALERLPEETRRRLQSESSELRPLGADFAGSKEELLWLQEHSPVILMGGEGNDEARAEWDIYPEKPCILIGTQDMLLSRALNRGYGMSRYRWPMHFGLLNNDCLWVMDETQLMGVGVETSAQLEGFRHKGTLPTFGTCPTWWMSATLDETRLATVDHHKPAGGWPVEKLSDSERSCGRPSELIHATKMLSRAVLKDASSPLTLTSAVKDYARQIAKLIIEHHRSDTLTLVVVNRVRRAQEILEALTKGKPPLCDAERVVLIHSRFRPLERKRHMELLFGKGDRIVIATQAVEAGVDVSARLLITELAPWSSLVQRMGRCNRGAETRDAEVMWVDVQPKDEQDEVLLPYTTEQLAAAREGLLRLSEASPVAVGAIEVSEKQVVRPVIRRRDLVDLFDTTPDLCGQDLDVSRYIRDGEDSDAQFFWRDIPANAFPTNDEKPPHRNELCRVSITDAAKFLGKKARAWRWNPLSTKWEASKLARPGAVYLVDVDSGGYSETLGWTAEPKDRPVPCPAQDGELESYGDNRLTFTGKPQTIADHTSEVVIETASLAAGLELSAALATALRTAASWHDIGKAHAEFQKLIRNGDISMNGQLWAKSARRGGTCARHGFRHELASALAWLLGSPVDAAERDLIAYLIAAHHGKVRLSIRSLPGETGDERDPEKLFARGVWQGDELPPVALREFTTPGITLDLSFMRMGEAEHGPSWLARTIALRDRPDLGPFRLAYLEDLLRAADARASRKATT